MDQARARLIALTGCLPATTVDLGEAAGLVVAEDIVAARDLPGFDNSAMDGFALRARDLTGASRDRPARLQLTGEVRAGSVFPGEVTSGSAVRIMTGAPLPAGADAVLEVEETATQGAKVLAFREAEPARNVRAAGSDIGAGETALPGGTYLGPAQLALLAALGVSRPVCIPRLRVAVLATGDELVDVDQEPGPGQVVDVSVAWAAAIRQIGAVAVPVARARDTLDDVRRALKEAAGADLVVSVGGVSVGEYDLVRTGVQELGELDFWKVAMRPGKPLAIGRVLDRPFVGLPGNPVSAFVGFEVFVLPAILAMSGRPEWGRPLRQARLAAAIRTPRGLRTFARARLEPQSDGEPPLAHPAAGQGSYQVRWLAASNALLEVPEQVDELQAGAMVMAILVDQPPGPPL